MLRAPPKTNSGTLDPFVDTMVHEDVSDVLPMTLDRDALRAIDPTTVLIAHWPTPLKTKFYRNLLPELQITICPECFQVNFILFLHYDFYELKILNEQKRKSFVQLITRISNCRKI